MTMRLPSPRSFLFVPGSRPDMVRKVTRVSPDIAVIDLEDAVPAAEKDSARDKTVQVLAEGDFGDTTMLVRINPVDSPWFTSDVEAIARTGHGIVLPKYEKTEQIHEVRDRFGQDAGIMVGLETALGVADCRELLQADIDGVFFGAEDYIADIGGRRTAEGSEVLYARSAVCLAAFLAGVPSIDQAVVSVREDERFRADAVAGLNIGYRGKICVHPRQVELAHEIFTPSQAEIDHANAVLEAAETGVAVVDGQMVDEVHLRMARSILSRAGR